MSRPGSVINWSPSTARAPRSRAKSAAARERPADAPASETRAGDETGHRPDAVVVPVLQRRHARGLCESGSARASFPIWFLAVQRSANGDWFDTHVGSRSALASLEFVPAPL